MPLAPADRSLLDPESLAAHSFATGFRGYDQDEVRRFLGQVADAVGRLLEAQAGLERRLTAAESRAAAPRPFDEAELAAALGEETAQVLVAARQAATDIRAKAEQGAARLLEEAANEAAARRRAADEHAAKERAAVAELRRTAEAELAARRRESEAQAAEFERAAEAAAAEVRSAAAADVERLLNDARADADARRADAAAAAAAARSTADAEIGQRRAEAEALLVARSEEAEREAERIRASAEEERRAAVADAEAQREAATEEGRAMVDEAQLVRERVLKDLARRRRTARGQLEQLRVARERLLEAYEVVRRTLDEATGELRIALPEARLAAEEVGRRAEAEPEVSVDDLETELEMARAAGLPIVMVDDRSPDPVPPHHDVSEDQPVSDGAEEAGPHIETDAGTDGGTDTEPDPDAAVDVIPEAGAVPDVRIVGAVVAGEAVGSVPADPGSPGSEAVASDDGTSVGEPEPITADVEVRGDIATPDEPLPAGPSEAADASELPDGTPAGPEPEPAGPAPELPAERVPADEGPELEAPAVAPVSTPPVPADEPAAGPVAPSADTPVATSEEGTAPGSVLDESGSESEIPGPTAVPPVDEPAPDEPGDPDAGSPERSGQPHDEAAVRAEVDALFARIRASREAGTAGVPTTDPVESVQEAPTGIDVDEPDPEASNQADPSGHGLVSLLERRDAAIEEAEHRLARRLKRVLADEQSAVLDTVRRSRSLPRFDEVLPSPSDHVATYVEAARDDLTAAAEAGADFAEGSPPAGGVRGDDLAADLADELTGRLRTRLERCFIDAEAGDGDGGDEEELTNRIRACYREWKTTQITEVARHVVLAAFNRGQYDALPAGSLLQWVIDDSGQPCPDAEDNALAGAVGKGDPFPTGHCRPPAHPGCRCLVVPARQ